MRKLLLGVVATLAMALPAGASAATLITYQDGYIYENIWRSEDPSGCGTPSLGYAHRSFNDNQMGGTTNGRLSVKFDDCSISHYPWYGTYNNTSINSGLWSAPYCGRGSSGVHVLIHVRCRSNYGA